MATRKTELALATAAVAALFLASAIPAQAEQHGGRGRPAVSHWQGGHYYHSSWRPYYYGGWGYYSPRHVVVSTYTEPVYVVQPAPVVVAEPAPVVVAQPAPVYVAQPAPVVVAQPAPVYVQPAPVYVQPAPVIVEPAPAAVVVLQHRHRHVFFSFGW
jgi:hypothetical protein